ncbi:hypothetical protein [Demequina flava]|uniref:hypothetical protein n=1 Tax=Demequina flava TaxID=1095025 RepID=UPI000AB865D6|nr:hypothetical protein [Demequina flava]
MTQPTPQWLILHTQQTGDDPTLTGTQAHPRHCKKCGRLTLTGYDSHIMAGLAITNPNPLTPRLEAAAVILHIPTYRLWGTPGHYQLTPRHQPRIPPLGTHPPANQVTVLAQHNCHHPPLSRETLPTRPPQSAIDLERIPF